MMPIPQSTTLSTRELTRVFGKVTATYKFYWFLCLLHSHVVQGFGSVRAIDIAARMVAMAWEAMLVHRLSFGCADQIHSVTGWLIGSGRLKPDMKEDEVATSLSALATTDKEVSKQLRSLLTHVPYCFLSPWLGSDGYATVAERSRQFDAGCLYAIDGRGDEMTISVNPAWTDYLTANYTVLHDFAMWNLSAFVQQRNPNVPNIPAKLVRQHERSSLTPQRNFWKAVMEGGTSVHCIYTGLLLTPADFDLDHFIPWSFVCHDQIWNLIPADPSINSSKCDRLPSLDDYLPALARTHQKAVTQWLAAGKSDKILDDYAAMGLAPRDLASMADARLVECFRKTFAPMAQIAANMGFEPWVRTS